MDISAHGVNSNASPIKLKQPHNQIPAALAPPLTANQAPYQQPHKPPLDLLMIVIQNHTPAYQMDFVINLKEKKLNVEEIIYVIGEMDQEESRNKFKFV